MLKNVLDSILRAVLLAVWTAFESLATDLWIKSVDSRPKSLAYNVVMLKSTGGIKANKAVANQSQKQQEPSIRYSDLADYDFDLTGNMGKLLKSSDRIKLDSLAGICSAYFDAFRINEHPRKDTSNILYQRFNAVYGELKTLESIRNLLAHRGGIVDAQYLREVEEYTSTSLRPPIDTIIPIDGELVGSYIRMTIDTNLFLLGFVGKQGPRI